MKIGIEKPAGEMSWTITIVIRDDELGEWGERWRRVGSRARESPGYAEALAERVRRAFDFDGLRPAK